MPRREPVESGDIELARWLRVVRGHVVLVLVMTLGIAALATAVAMTKPLSYRTSASVLLQPSLNDTQNGSSATMSIGDEVKLANSDLLLRQVRRQLAPGTHPGYHAEAAGQVLTFTATARTARAATAAAVAAADGFIALRGSGRTAQYRQAEASLNQAITALESDISATSDPTHLKALTGQLADYRDALNRLLVQNDLTPSGGAQRIGEVAAPGRVSPSVATYAVVGALVGLLLGLLIALTRDAYDDRVRDLTGLGKAVDGDGPRNAILTQVRRDSRRRSRAARVGEAAIAATPSRTSDSYAVMRSALERRLPAPRVILVAGVGNGDRGEEAAANIAAAFARGGRRTILVSADAGRAASQEPVQPPYAASAAPRKPATLHDLLLVRQESERLWAPPPVMDNLWHMAADRTGALSLPDVDLETLRGAVATLKGQFHTVVILGPPVTSYPDTALLSRATDGVVLAVTARHTRERDVRDATRVVEQLGGSVIGAVLEVAGSGGSGDSHFGTVLPALQGQSSPDRSPVKTPADPDPPRATHRRTVNRGEVADRNHVQPEPQAQGRTQ